MKAENMLCLIWYGVEGCKLKQPEGAKATCASQVGFDCRARLEFQGSKIGSHGELLLFEGLYGVLGLHDITNSLLKYMWKGQYWLQTSQLAIALHH